MDAVARIAFLQEPQGKILPPRGHFRGIQVIFRGISHIFPDGLRHRRGSSVGRLDLLQQLFRPGFGFIGKHQIPGMPASVLLNTTAGKLDPSGCIRVGEGHFPPVFRQCPLGDVVTGAFSRIGGFSPVKLRFGLGVIGQVQIVPAPAGADRNQSFLLQNPPGIPAEGFLSEHICRPALAVVKIIILFPKIQCTALRRHHIHHRIGIPDSLPHLLQIHLGGVGASRAVLMVIGNILHQQRNVFRPPEDLLLQLHGVVYITFLRYRQKQQSQRCRHRNGHHISQGNTLFRGMAAEIVGQNQHDQPKDQYVKKALPGDGIRHHQTGDQGQQRKQHPRDCRLSPADRPAYAGRHQTADGPNRDF